jgi:ankyrin repeat protein
MAKKPRTAKGQTSVRGPQLYGPEGDVDPRKVKRLMAAVARGAAEAAQELLAGGARAHRPPAVVEESTSDDPVTALLIAIDAGDYAAFDRILPTVDANALTPKQVSPFLRACSSGRIRMVQSMLAAGARATTQAVENSALMERQDVFDLLVAGTIVSQGAKSKDRDALILASERAKRHGWPDVNKRLRPHRTALGL